MTSTCPECGAPVAEGDSCRAHFDALLLLEWRIPGGAGERAHFFAVSAYVLQHPDTMGYTPEALAALRESVTGVVRGRVTMDELRARVRGAADGAARVFRRPGESTPVSWKRGDWPMTVADVLTVDPEADAYAERVNAWARATVEALE